MLDRNDNPGKMEIPSTGSPSMTNDRHESKSFRDRSGRNGVETAESPFYPGPCVPFCVPPPVSFRRFQVFGDLFGSQLQVAVIGQLRRRFAAGMQDRRVVTAAEIMADLVVTGVGQRPHQVHR